jgi:P-type Cu+ transporter
MGFQEDHVITSTTLCAHCGDPLNGPGIIHGGKLFCCNGCRVVYEILGSTGTCPAPVVQPVDKNRFAYLDEPTVVEHLREFSDGQVSAVSFLIPQMYCSSCVWVLEHLYRMDPGILLSRVEFLKKAIAIRYDEEKTSLRNVVELLTTLGYEPRITLESVDRSAPPPPDRTLYYRIGIAGFCFGNIMILSFPEYLSGGMVDGQLHHVFAYLNLILSLPVIFYCSTGYFQSAAGGLRKGIFNIDVPIAIGIAIVFLRSVADIVSGAGPGFLDSLSGLVFFLLLGRLFQNKTYDSLNFERSYTSYFPLAVTTRHQGTERTAPVSDLRPGDRMVIRNNEIVPADAVLIGGDAAIDYSFVTGESRTVQKVPGDLVHAGGRQVGGAIELDVVTEVSQGYLTRLWNETAFAGTPRRGLTTLANAVSKYFSAGVLIIAACTAVFWLPRNPAIAFDAVTAVLIVACPCALALATPFAFGTALRVFGQNKFYVKNTAAVETLAGISTIILDKTGTLTRPSTSAVRFLGTPLTENQRLMVASLVRNSHHPLSRTLYESLMPLPLRAVRQYREIPNSGIEGKIEGVVVRIGSRSFAGTPAETDPAGDSGTDTTEARVYVRFGTESHGYFALAGAYREGIESLVTRLQVRHEVVLLSGDTEWERPQLESRFGTALSLHFEQTPADKMAFVAARQQHGATTMMVGDGLNDAGALQQADVGVAVTENISTFSPACDAILEGSYLTRMDTFIALARASKQVVLWSFAISVLYNAVGLSFAVRGALSPIVAAILMPVSSVTVVAFTTLAVHMIARRRGLLS